MQGHYSLYFEANWGSNLQFGSERIASDNKSIGHIQIYDCVCSGVQE